MNRSSRKRHVEVAGAGFAGLVAAIAFAQRGWSVRVHERAATVRAFGAGIWIWANGWRVLKAIGAHDEAIASGCRTRSLERYDHRGEVLMKRIHLDAFDTYLVTITRQRLVEALLIAAEREDIEIVTGSTIAAADPDGALIDERGRRYPADLAVAADGVHSRLRDSLGLEVRRRPLDYGAIRLLVSRTAEEIERGDDIVSYANGERRLLFNPCSPDSTYLCFTVRSEDGEGQAIPLDKSAWTATFPRLAGVFARVGPEGRWDRFENVRLSRWSVGRVAIIGDAAHAMAPSLGQGGGCAMMNALALAETVAAADDVLAGLAAWEERERPLTEWVQEVSTSFSGQKTDWHTPGIFRAARHVPTGANA